MTGPRSNTPTRPPDTGFETVAIVAVAVVFAVASAHWLAASLACLIVRHTVLDAGLGDSLHALGRLPDHLSDPRHAWSQPAADQLPGPVLYWLCTGLVAAAAMATLAAAFTIHARRQHTAPDKRRRLGVATQARLARTRDLAPLLVRQPEPGRFILGRWGRHLLATEGVSTPRRRAVRGAVAVFGPSQSGKTTGLITGIDRWQAPAIVCSVKTDILRATIDRRRDRGAIKVYDPIGFTSHATSQWSPLSHAETLRGAVRAAGMLARAGGPELGGNDRFWRGQAEQLLAAMLWTAANTQGQTMRDVVRWVLELDQPADGSRNTLSPLVRVLVDADDPETASAARSVQGWLQGQWSTDPRTTSSVYATARDAVWPWADPAIAASATTTDITLDWLLSGPNTLYLCAPLGDESRVGLVFAALLHDLIAQAFERANRSGALDPGLLILLDETANTPLPKLPEWASTVTGAGIQLVTVWQSKAQLDETYGRHADTVLTNHRTKLIYPSGLSDLATIRYVSELAGTEHVRTDLDGARRDDHRRAQVPAAAVPLVDVGVLRGLGVGDALLLHGHLPPAWVRHR